MRAACPHSDLPVTPLPLAGEGPEVRRGSGAGIGLVYSGQCWHGDIGSGACVVHADTNWQSRGDRSSPNYALVPLATKLNPHMKWLIRKSLTRLSNRFQGCR